MRIALFAASLLLLASCNLARLVERHETRILKREHILPRTFHASDGDHFTWARDTTDGSWQRGKPKLMLIHGITGTGRSQWSGNAKHLGERFDLIIPDLLGHGKSSWNWAGNSVQAQVAHLLMVLDSLGVKDPVYVVGNSYGGAMAANFAERHPERVRKLVIYDGPASDYTAAMADSVAKANGARDIMDLISPTGLEGQQRVFNVVFHQPPKLPDFALRQYNKRYIVPYHASHVRLMEDLLAREKEFATKVYHWTMPVYVIWGADDRLIPLSTGRGIMLRNSIPGDHLIVIPDCGHLANREKPEEFERVLMQMLTD